MSAKKRFNPISSPVTKISIVFLIVIWGYLPAKGQISERIRLSNSLAEKVSSGALKVTPVSYINKNQILALTFEKEDSNNDGYWGPTGEATLIELPTEKILFSVPDIATDDNYSASATGKVAYIKAAIDKRDTDSFTYSTTNSFIVYDYEKKDHRTLHADDKIIGIDMSRDGSTLAIMVKTDKYKVVEVIIWNLKTYSESHRFSFKLSSVNTTRKLLILSPDGSMFVLTTNEKEKSGVYSSSDGSLLEKIILSSGEFDGIYSGSYKFSNTGERIAFKTYRRNKPDSPIIVKNLFSGKSIKLYSKNLIDLEFFDDEKKIITSLSYDKDDGSGWYYNMQLWDITSGKSLGIDNQTYAGGKEIISNSNNSSFLLYCTYCTSNSMYVYYPSTKLAIEQKVKDRVNAWQQKDMYETTAAYQKRVTKENRRELIDTYTNKIVDSLAAESFYERINDHNYDADNQTFELTFSNGTSIYLPVPLEDARTFGNNVNSIRFSGQDYALNNEGRFTLRKAKIHSSATGNTYNYDSGQQVAFNTSQLAANFDPIDVNVDTDESNSNVQKGSRKVEVGKADVDVNIPETAMSNPDGIAVVIGNRRYEGDTPDVDYAVNDAKVMRDYLKKTLGFKEGNILYVENASKTRLEVLLGDDKNQGKLANYLKPGRSDVFVFYSGHGAPDPNTETGYLMPVDADPTALAISGYPLETLYDNLAQLEARSVSVVIDACFSGATGGGEMLIQNASPIGLKVRNPAAKLENGFVVTASSGSQVSSWYPEKGHGLLTYFWLKGVQGAADLNGDGTITASELSGYLTDPTDGLPYWARRLHSRDQMPQVFGTDESSVIVEYN